MPAAYALPVGVQTYSVRAALKEDRPAALARLADIGFEIVEAFGRPTDGDPVQAASEQRRDLDAAGLRALSTHSAAPIGESAEAMLDAAEILGVRWLVIGGPRQVPGFANDAFDDVDRVRRLADALSEAGQAAATRGLRLAFHNHWREIEPMADGTRPYDILVAEADPDIDLEVDVYWAQAGGAEPSELIGKYRDRVQLLHLKDGAEPLGKGEPQGPVGDGAVDNAGAVRAATAARFAFLEIDQCAGDPFDVLAAGARHLVGNGLGTLEVVDV